MSKKIAPENIEDIVALTPLQQGMLFHFLEDQVETFQVYLAVKPVQDLDEPTHMRPFKPVRQVNINVDLGDGFLDFFLLVQNFYRIGDSLDPDISDIDTPVIVEILDIFHGLVSNTDR